MPNIVDRFNIGGEEYHIEPVIDQTPEQGSPHAVASGAVWPYTNDRGDTPKDGSTGIFTRGGAYNFFGGITDPDKWLTKVFAQQIMQYVTRVLTTSYAISNVAFHDDLGLFLAWGPKTFWSEDGVTWTEGTGFEATRYFEAYAVVRGNGVTVATTTNAYAYWSEDDKTWTACTGIPSTATVKKVHFCGGMFFIIATGSGVAGIYWSEDGKTWTKDTGTISNYGQNVDVKYDTRSIEYHNGIWVVVSSGGKYWSTDGKAWSSGTGQTTWAMSITYVDDLGLWIAGTTSCPQWSTDGKAWTAGTYSGSSSPSLLCNIVKFSGKYIGYALGGGGILGYSTDGKAWTGVDLRDTSGGSAVAYGWSNIYLTENAAYLGGADNNNRGTPLYVSYNGTSWSEKKDVSGNSLKATQLATGMGMVVVAGAAGYTFNGATWYPISGLPTQWSVLIRNDKVIFGGSDGICVASLQMLMNSGFFTT